MMGRALALALMAACACVPSAEGAMGILCEELSRELAEAAQKPPGANRADRSARFRKGVGGGGGEGEEGEGRSPSVGGAAS